MLPRRADLLSVFLHSAELLGLFRLGGCGFKFGLDVGVSL
jgi:hypothetical protein